MLISVIVPCYNAGDALQRCAESLFDAAIPNETQLIFVDDASTDGVMEKIAEKYRDRENFILLHHPVRCGVSASRNTGLAAAQGKYIAFCDADDYVEKDFFTKLLAAIEKSRADLAVCAFFRETRNRSESLCLPDVSTAHALIARTMPSIGFNVCWNKLYRREKLEQLALRFDESSCAAEDLLFNAAYLVNAAKIAVVDAPLYHYVAGDVSITARETAATAHSSVAAAREIVRWLTGEEMAPARRRLLVDALMTTLRADGFTAADTCAILEELPPKFWRDGRFGLLKQSTLHFAAYAPRFARFFVRQRYAVRRLLCRAAN